MVKNQNLNTHVWTFDMRQHTNNDNMWVLTLFWLTFLLTFGYPSFDFHVPSGLQPYGWPPTTPRAMAPQTKLAWARALANIVPGRDRSFSRLHKGLNMACSWPLCKKQQKQLKNIQKPSKSKTIRSFFEMNVFLGWAVVEYRTHDLRGWRSGNPQRMGAKREEISDAFSVGRSYITNWLLANKAESRLCLICKWSCPVWEYLKLCKSKKHNVINYFNLFPLGSFHILPPGPPPTNLGVIRNHQKTTGSGESRDELKPWTPRNVPFPSPRMPP